MILLPLLPIFSKQPFDDAESSARAVRLGLLLFLASLAMLFGGTLVGFAVIRVKLSAEWPANLPQLPIMLWLSTTLLVASSGTMQWALLSARRDNPGSRSLAMLLTLMLGLAFLGLQSAAWITWLAQITDFWAGSDAYRLALTGFYLLTGLHAAHVIGGLVPMAVVTIRSLHGRYHAERHEGIALVGIYWHFLDVVWLILYAALLIGV